MTKVLSFFKHANKDVLLNHQHYCLTHGYTHQWVTTETIYHEKMRAAYKYNYLLQQLKNMAEGELLMLLDEHSAILSPIKLERLMAERDSLVLNGPNDSNQSPLTMNNMIVVRNTTENRAILFDILMSLHGALAGQNQPEEEVLLQKFSTLYTNAMHGDTYINVNWRIPDWFKHKIFVIFLGANAAFDSEGSIDRNTSHQRMHDANFERLLFQQINDCFINGKPLLKVPDYPEISAEPLSCFNPAGKIALVTLYTHHIARYARVSEHNVKRYCDRHGYAYHVYREVPSSLGLNISGNWLKPWLLQQHIADHDWIVWVDADVIFRNQSIKLESLFDGRNTLFAKDWGAWPLNSGVMAFKNTPENIDLLTKMWSRILSVNDKSSIYSDQGDQFHIIGELEAANMLNEEHLSNCLSINTPPPLSNANTFLTHYMGYTEPYRSVYMAHHDAESKRRG